MFDLRRSWKISAVPCGARLGGTEKIKERKSVIAAVEKSDTPAALKNPPTERNRSRRRNGAQPRETPMLRPRFDLPQWIFLNRPEASVPVDARDGFRHAQVHSTS